jgi:DNA excision repair protein ERCC-2
MLTAKEKICPQNPGVCDAGNCPLALGYYDRIRPAVQDALRAENLRREDLQGLAVRHQVCPFELSLDAARWFDLIVGDFNYAFDPRVSLKRFFGEDGAAHILLVDEAHNLADRAREMFSAQLSQADLASGRRYLQEVAPALAKALQRVRRAWLQWRRQLASEGAIGTGGVTEAEFPIEPEGDDTQPLLFGPPPVRGKPAPSPEPPWPSQRPADGLRIATSLPESVIESLRHFRREAEDWLIRESAASHRDTVRQLYFTALDFLRTAEHFDGCSRVVDQWDASAERLRLFCVDPSRRLAEAIPKDCAQVFFSGTLTPLDFFRRILGGAETDSCLQLGSPFPPQHLAVLVHDRIGTALRQRQVTFDAVSEAIAAFIGERRGNYLVFFPSYRYLEQVRERFCAKHGDLACLGQVPGMTEEDRGNFLAQFTRSRETTLVGFAVMGGVFGESIDLVGERLTGAVVVGVGLPQLSYERDLIRDYYGHTGGMGFAYAYRYPGMNRVLQAAGRVIRSETDRGGVLLIDQRFRQAEYRQLLPRGWHLQSVRSAEDIQRVLRRFWAANDGIAPA